MEIAAKESPMDSFIEPDIGRSSESFLRFLEAQKELFHSQIDQLQNIVATQCKLTGANPLSQEMAAGALSIKIGKRPRDLLNPKAIQYMQSVFSIKDTISKKETREISALCGVTVTQVRDFFAGQRSRVRQLVRFSRENAVRFEACEAPLDERKGSPNGNKASPDESTAPDRSNPVDGIMIDSSNATPVSNPVPLNCVDPSNATEGPSSSSQDENIPGIDDSDKHFLQNILNLMRKEKTFSGQAKLMEWVLQIHNSAVLHWFLTKGGVMILATWLSLAALEEQTTIIRTIFKVLCHLPLHKALPAHMSAILQTVNRLRFYRTSDISNRARILLSRWSKLFVRSQALKKSQVLKRPSSANGTTDIQKEKIRRLRISEILSDESWQSKIDIPEDILALTNEESENSRKEPPKQATKLLTASGENSNKKLALSGSPLQTRGKRKVLLVEHPGSKTAGRSAQVARSATTNQSRPMSADDIQKAKMRATFMQSKYFDKSKTSLAGNSLEKSVNGKPTIENLQERTNNQKAHTVTQSAEIRLSPSIQAVVNCEKISLSSTSGTQTLASLSQSGDSPPMSDPLQLKQEEDTTVIALPSESSDALLETSKPSVVPQEPLWKNSKRDQVQWQTPPEMWMNDAWSVGAGEKSKEVEVQTARIRREKETIYSSIHDIPSNPKEPWDVEMDFDDTLTPEIPTEQPPEADGSEAASPRTGDANVEQVPAVASAQVANGLEPDLELLSVLLKNPELVFALTSGQGNGFSSAETVALLDMLKRSNINLPGALSGLGEKPVEKPGMTSLPSPTPPAEREMRWRMESAPSAVPNLSHQPVMPGPRFPPAVPTQTISLAQHRIPSTYPAALGMPEKPLGMPEKPPPPMTLNQSSTVVTTLQNAAAAPVQKPYHSVAPQAQSSTTPSQHFNALESNMHPSTNLPHLARIPQQTAQPDVKNFGRLQQPQQAPPPPVSMVPSPPPAAAAQPTTRFSPWSGGNAAAGGSGGQQHRAYPDSPTPATEHFPPNLSSYKAFPGSRMPLSGIDRNEHLGSGAPEFETWSPEGSPARCRELNYERHPDHRSYSSGASGSRRDSGRNYRQSEWPPRHYRSGNSSSSSGRSRSSDRRWRERERDRDHRRR